MGSKTVGNVNKFSYICIMKKVKKTKDDIWLWITYGIMGISICVLMYQVSTLKEEIRTLKEIRK